MKITSLEEIDRHFLPSFAVLMPPFQARLMQMRTTSSPPFNRLPFNSFHFLGEILSDVSNTHARARYFTIIHLAKWIQTGCRVKHARQQSRLLIPLGVRLNFDEPRYYKSSVLYVIKRRYDKKCWRTRKNLFPSDSIYVIKCWRRKGEREERSKKSGK